MLFLELIQIKIQVDLIFFVSMCWNHRTKGCRGAPKEGTRVGTGTKDNVKSLLFHPGCHHPRVLFSRLIRERLFIEEKVPEGIEEAFLRRSRWGPPQRALTPGPNRGAAPPTCVLAGEFGLGIAHPSGPLTAVLVATVLAVLVSVASPAFRDAGPIREAVEFLFAAFDHRWQH